MTHVSRDPRLDPGHQLEAYYNQLYYRLEPVCQSVHELLAEIQYVWQSQPQCQQLSPDLLPPAAATSVLAPTPDGGNPGAAAVHRPARL